MSRCPQEPQILTPMLVAWRAGDRRAATRLIGALTTRLRSSAERLTTTSAVLEPDDLLQEVFTTFATQLHGFDITLGDAGLCSWFRVTMQRRAWALLKREGITGAESTEDLQAVEESSIEERLDTRKRIGEVRELLENRERFAASAATRGRLARVLDRVEATIVGEQRGIESLSALARSVGWSPQHLYVTTRRLGAAVGTVTEPYLATPRLEAAVATGTNGTQAVARETLVVRPSNPTPPDGQVAAGGKRAPVPAKRSERLPGHPPEDGASDCAANPSRQCSLRVSAVRPMTVGPRAVSRGVRGPAPTSLSRQTGTVRIARALENVRGPPRAASALEQPPRSKFRKRPLVQSR